MKRTTIAPSPTAVAQRMTDPDRTSPTAKTGRWGWTAILPGLGLLADDFTDPYLRIFDLTEEATTQLRRDVVIAIAPIDPIPIDVEVGRVDSGVIWLSLTSRVWTITVSPLAIVSTGSLATSHLKWTRSVGK